MPLKSCSDEEFIALFKQHGAQGTAKVLKIGVRQVFARRRRLESKLAMQIITPNRVDNYAYTQVEEYPGRLNDEIQNGQLLLGSDSHYWPGVITDAHRAFVKLAGDIKPEIIVKNGDEYDFPSISRWPLDWEKRPSVKEELEYTGDRLEEIRQASKNSKCFFPLGNHDARYELRLAQHAQQYAGVKGVHLKDHCPGWRPCWSLFINGHTVIKHRFKSGIANARANAAFSGKHIFTGHTHRMQLYSFADYNGTRWGMECGTMAMPYGEQFGYVEDNPREWTSGFVLLTFHNGKLLPPEVVICPGDGTYEFRGRSYQL